MKNLRFLLVCLHVLGALTTFATHAQSKVNDTDDVQPFFRSFQVSPYAASKRMLVATFDKKSTSIALCELRQSKPECQLFAKKAAVDAVPVLDKQASHDVIAFSLDDKSIEICKILGDVPQAKLACTKRSATFWAPFSDGSSGADRLSAAVLSHGGTTNCSYSKEVGLACTKARPYLPRESLVIGIGKFTQSEDLQIIYQENSAYKLCNIKGSSCRLATGLENFESSSSVSSDHYSKSAGRNLLKGFSLGGLTACLAYSESRTHVAFQCEFRSLNGDGSQFRPTTLQAGSKDDFTYFQAPLHRLNESRALYRTAAEMEKQVVSSAGFGGVDSFPVAISARVGGGPQLVRQEPDVWEFFIGDQSYYSDQFGMLLFNWGWEWDRNRVQCIAECVARRDEMKSGCPAMGRAAGTTAVVIGAGAVLIGAATTGGGSLVFIGELAFGYQTAEYFTSLACNAIAEEVYRRCVAGCPLR